jgi:anion-transporting  ArsA/GET3 family ATPase
MSARVRIVTGKGGVGKTAVATALAVAEAQRGHKVLVCEIRAGDRVTALLEAAPVGFRMREVRERLWVVDMNADDAIHEYVILRLRFETVYRAVFENRLVRGLVRLVPSLSELVMLGKVWYHAQEQVRGQPRFDVVILDAPATGHALALLRTPRTVEEAVPAGPLKDISRDLHAMLADQRRTVLHIVTTPEEMPVNEALEIEQAVRGEIGIALGRAVVNQRLEPLPPGTLATLEPLATDAELGPSIRALQLREGKRQAGEEQLLRLPPELLANAVSLPRLVGSGFGLSEVERLANHLHVLVDA